MIASIDPPVVAAGSPPVTIRILGERFADAIVLFDGGVREPSSAAQTELTLDLTMEDVLVPRVHQLRVINAGTGLNASNIVRLDVAIPNAVPVITALIPDRAIVGAGDLELVIEGSDFAPGASATWAGETLAGSRIDDRRLAVAVPMAKLAGVGSFPVVVTNPVPGGGMSAPFSFVVRDLAPPAGVLLRASVSDTGAQIDTFNYVAFVSDDGRHVAFSATGDGVVPGDANGRTDIFVRDTCTGASACTPTTIPISTKPDGTFSSSCPVNRVVTTGDMRYVLFMGDGDLVPGLPGNALVIRDTCIGASGCTPTTTRASPDQARDDADVSEDGRYVAFATVVAHVATDTNATLDIYLYDTCRGASGCTPSTALVSATPGGNAGNNQSATPSISEDGRYVAFQSSSSDLVAGDSNGAADIFVRDTCAGASGCTPSTIRASVDGNGAAGNFESRLPSIDRGGRFVAFLTQSKLAATDTDNSDDIYTRDTCIGAASCTPSTFHATPAAASPAIEGPRSLSRNGRYVAFQANGAAPGFRWDAFVADTCIGAASCTPTVHAISSGGAVPDGDVSRQIVISADGRYASIVSAASNLVPNDTNGRPDAFLSATGF